MQVDGDGSINGDRKLMNVGVKDWYEWCWYHGSTSMVLGVEIVRVKVCEGFRWCQTRVEYLWDKT